MGSKIEYQINSDFSIAKKVRYALTSAGRKANIDAQCPYLMTFSSGTHNATRIAISHGLRRAINVPVAETNINVNTVRGVSSHLGEVSILPMKMPPETATNTAMMILFLLVI